MKDVSLLGSFDILQKRTTNLGRSEGVAWLFGRLPSIQFGHARSRELLTGWWPQTVRRSQEPVPGVRCAPYRRRSWFVGEFGSAVFESPKSRLSTYAPGRSKRSLPVPELIGRFHCWSQILDEFGICFDAETKPGRHQRERLGVSFWLANLPDVCMSQLFGTPRLDPCEYFKWASHSYPLLASFLGGSRFRTVHPHVNLEFNDMIWIDMICK